MQVQSSHLAMYLLIWSLVLLLTKMAQYWEQIFTNCPSTPVADGGLWGAGWLREAADAWSVLPMLPMLLYAISLVCLSYCSQRYTSSYELINALLLYACPCLLRIFLVVWATTVTLLYKNQPALSCCDMPACNYLWLYSVQSTLPKMFNPICYKKIVGSMHYFWTYKAISAFSVHAGRGDFNRVEFL